MMNKSNIKEIISKLRSGQRLEVVILDNNNIQFLELYERYFPFDAILKQYDIILVPVWVYNELATSQRTVDFLSRVTRTIDNVYYIDENDYSWLIDKQEIFLYHFLYSSCLRFTQIIGYLKRTFGKCIYSLEEELPTTWLQQFYEEAFTSFGAMEARRKNAGEISILLLSYLLYFRYRQHIANITLFTDDTDLLEMKPEALKFLRKQKRSSRTEETLLSQSITYPITFRTSDMLIRDAVLSGDLHQEKAKEFRKPHKTIYFMRQSSDGTIDTDTQNVSVEDFFENYVYNLSIKLLF